MSKPVKIEGPAWSLDEEYTGLAAGKLLKELQFIEVETKTLEVRFVGSRHLHGKITSHGVWAFATRHSRYWFDDAGFCLCRGMP